MEHVKKYHQIKLAFEKSEIIIEGPVSAAQMRGYHFAETLDAFRKPEEQFQAMCEITLLPEGRLIIARDGDCIVGYAVFLYPDPLERWSQGGIENLLELGAIEVADSYRRISLGKKMLEVAMMDEHMEDYIIITTEYYWHWDLKGSGLDVWQYRDMMEKMMNTGGLEWFATDDEEISSHPANCLMVRIGKNVDLKTQEKFDRLRFRYRYMY